MRFVVVIGVVTGLAAIAGGVIAIDDRYMPAAQAADLIQMQAEMSKRVSVARERGDLENQLELVRLELKYLAKTGGQDAETQYRIQYLMDRETVISKRLLELNSTE